MKLGEFVCRLRLNATYVAVAGLRVNYHDSIVYREYFTAINHDSDSTTIAQPYL